MNREKDAPPGRPWGRIMKQDKISMRQLLVLLFSAILSPAIQILPARGAELAGRAGWLSTLFALPVLLGLCWVFFALQRAAGEGEGLAGAFRAVLGTAGGKALTAVYLAWGVVMLSAGARRCALRILSTGYRNAALPLFIVLLLGAALWMGRGRLPALARAGEIFYLALSAVLALTVFFSLFNVEARNVLPIWVGDLPAALRATLPALSVLGYAVFAAFLGGGVAPREDNRGRGMRWAAAACLVLTAMQFACLGNFGPELVGRMDTPFFSMAEGIGLEGAFQRAESVVVALWVFSDLALLGLLVFSCRAMAGSLLGRSAERYSPYIIVALALAGALFLFPDAFALTAFLDRWATAGNLLLGFVVPLLVFLLGKLRRKV